MNIISIQNVNLEVGRKILLNNANWELHEHEKIAIVGRNGVGKSSFLRLVQGEMVPDKGAIQIKQGVQMASLSQNVPLTVQEPVFYYLVSQLNGEVVSVLRSFFSLQLQADALNLAEVNQQMDAMHAWGVVPTIESMANRLSLNLFDPMVALSGGMKRRVLLASALIAAPDLLLLDEPTNHLDLNSIEWLEEYLKNYNKTIIFVTHDRRFLSQVSTGILEIQGAKLHSYQCNYETYLDRKEARLLSEQRDEALFKKRLDLEETWIRQGIKARRTRNEGRVRALKNLREQYKNRHREPGAIKGLDFELAQSGKKVLEAKDITYVSAEGQVLLQHCSFLLMKGDRVGILGPNGCGKTTLIRLLLGEVLPSSGTIEYGTNLKIAYFDQLRQQLDDKQSILDNVSEGSDYIDINGVQRHVISYLNDFLFPSERIHQPISMLSGGERNRLLLAKLFTRPVNLLILDEPTNDLDIETLELLEELLIKYTGSLILISHDRAFINQTVTSILAFEEQGMIHEYIGDYDDYLRQKKAVTETSKKASSGGLKEHKKAPNKFKDPVKKELASVLKEIEKLEKIMKEIQTKMADPEFYQQDYSLINEVTERHTLTEQALEVLYKRWEHLEGTGD